MLIEAVGALQFSKDVATHILKWLTNLRRANKDRRRESLKAVNKIVALIRKTTAYSRGLRDGKQDFGTEAMLAEQWSDLAHDLAELKLVSLAKKCDLTGRFWADAAQFTPDFLTQADISFQSVERLARDLAISSLVRSQGSSRACACQQLIVAVGSTRRLTYA